ncbi:MAG TPA: tyrosine-type recombinase/integrase [Ktedonobacteraceae bacterium]|nr:tyrosine-type recombinase/integrase [Ktedonobacteraceae bacterium]
MTEPSNIVPFPDAGNEAWILSYQQACLSKHDEATIDAYTRILRQFTAWVARRPGHSKHFQPDQLTATVVEAYLSLLKEHKYSVSHRTRVKSVIKHFCQWLIDEKEALTRNPTSGIEIKAQQTLAPRILSPDQRFVLRNLVEKADDMRGKALFALGYWAGCRVSDVAYLLIEHTHVGPKIGWLHVGHKGEKFRDIDLLNEARRPLYEYIQHGGRDPESLYVFTSQRSPRLSEDGIHHWFRTLKRQANKEEWELIADLSFHDLRHDFAHRAREAGWTLEEVAYYLGHVTMKGTPAIQTTVRYTQVSRAQVKDKLRLMKG